jgi:predicted ABC-type transport system involved in lysophospholipase L1 biosynthesis ATPase subunit
MNENVTVVFHGFLNLANLEKLKLVEAINEYFDSNHREPIREENQKRFEEIGLGSEGKTCKCCGR